MWFWISVPFRLTLFLLPFADAAANDNANAEVAGCKPGAPDGVSSPFVAEASPEIQKQNFGC